MAKTLAFYREAIRELRDSGHDNFSASNGYTLRGDLSSGQKSAISRAYSEHGSSREREDESESPYYDDATEDGDWYDIDYFNYDELDYDEDFLDEEADSYGEDAAK